jgi:hypothetical protein
MHSLLKRFSFVYLSVPLLEENPLLIEGSPSFLHNTVLLTSIYYNL